jgi:hypothetical protein
MRNTRTLCRIQMPFNTLWKTIYIALQTIENRFYTWKNSIMKRGPTKWTRRKNAEMRFMAVTCPERKNQKRNKKHRPLNKYRAFSIES